VVGNESTVIDLFVSVAKPDFHLDQARTLFLFSPRAYSSSSMAGHVPILICVQKYACLFVHIAFEFYILDSFLLSILVPLGSNWISNYTHIAGHTRTPYTRSEDIAIRSDVISESPTTTLHTDTSGRAFGKLKRHSETLLDGIKTCSANVS
jgi:hypothetical protein